LREENKQENHKNVQKPFKKSTKRGSIEGCFFKKTTK